jgi:hypothetical protein
MWYILGLQFQEQIIAFLFIGDCLISFNFLCFENGSGTKENPERKLKTIFNDIPFYFYFFFFSSFAMGTKTTSQTTI